MSFSKFSILEMKKLYISYFIGKKIKGQTMISNKQNFKTEVLKMHFALLKIKIIGKFKLEIKSTNLSIDSIIVLQ